mgnify:FL=1
MSERKTWEETLMALSRMADDVVPALRALSRDPEFGPLREAAATVIAPLLAEIDEIMATCDLMMSPIPRCPVGHLTVWAIGGGRVVTEAECVKLALDLDRWASAIDRQRAEALRTAA